MSKQDDRGRFEKTLTEIEDELLSLYGTEEAKVPFHSLSMAMRSAGSLGHMHLCFGKHGSARVLYVAFIRNGKQEDQTYVVCDRWTRMGAGVNHRTLWLEKLDVLRELPRLICALQEAGQIDEEARTATSTAEAILASLKLKNRGEA